MPKLDSTKKLVSRTFYPASPRKNLIKQRFGRLTVQYFLGKSRGEEINRIRWRYYWIALCDCGNTVLVDQDSLKKNTQSCGCLQLDSVIKHGFHRRAEYQTWSGMKQRCRNPKDAAYINYGGRGISVCDRWLESFENFFEDMGPKPTPQYSLDRIDNDGNYCPANCKWATPKEQAANRRLSYSPQYLITYNGQTKNLNDWAISAGLKHGKCLVYRLRRGWPLDKALTQPPSTKKTGFASFHS